MLGLTIYPAGRTGYDVKFILKPTTVAGHQKVVTGVDRRVTFSGPQC